MVIPTELDRVNFNRPIFLEELDCTTTDTDILLCNSYSRLGINSCNHAQDISVRCTGKEITHYKLPYIIFVNIVVTLVFLL